jgi:hypothetical protein
MGTLLIDEGRIICTLRQINLSNGHLFLTGYTHAPQGGSVGGGDLGLVRVHGRDGQLVMAFYGSHNGPLPESHNGGLWEITFPVHVGQIVTKLGTWTDPGPLEDTITRST